MIGLLVWGIGLSQGLYVHRTAKHRKTLTYIHTSSGIRTRGPSVHALQVHNVLRLRGHRYRLVFMLCVFKMK
jgi:hypothetical protein